MDLWKYVDIYCERVEEGFFAEPVNLLSNGFFVFAGAMIIWFASRSAQAQQVRIYGALVAFIGGCSFLFHSFANQWSMIADMASIAACVFYVLYLYTHYILQFSLLRKALIFALLVGLSILLPMVISSTYTNGSEGYFGIWLVLLLLTVLDPVPAGRGVMVQVLGLFTLSLCVRSLDMAVCREFPLGVHFLWHTFNALLLYRLAQRFSITEDDAGGV